MVVYSYEVALYFGNALEYNGYWAQEAGLFVAALSSSVELVAAISMARFSRRPDARARRPRPCTSWLARRRDSPWRPSSSTPTCLPATCWTWSRRARGPLPGARMQSRKAPPLRALPPRPLHPARLADVFDASARLLREHKVPPLPLVAGRSHPSAGGRPDAVEVIVPALPVGRSADKPPSPAAFNRRPLPQVIVPLAQASPAPTSAAQSGTAAGEARCDLDQSSSIPIYSPEVLSAPLRMSDVRMASAMGSQQGRMRQRQRQ